MKTATIICEFNPFHNGHKYLIENVKRNYADRVVCIMSGSFVQRGDVAVCDKYVRASMALQSGCDIVVELPTVFAVANAHSFARGAIEIAQSMNTDMLCFGVENTDIDILNDVSNAFENKEFVNKINEQMKTGTYYPKAVDNVVRQMMSDEHANIIRGANNVLAIEYLKALKNTTIKPVAINRTKVVHDSNKPSGNIASASYIRDLIKQNKPYDMYTDIKIKTTACIDNIESAIMYKLKTMTKDEIENLPDVSEGLHNRIYDQVKRYNSLSELLSSLKTKRYIMSRLRRIVMCAVLGITKDDCMMNAQYIRVLGMNNTGAGILSDIYSLPIVAKVASDVSNLTHDAKHMFDIDTRASDLYSLACYDKSTNLNDYTAKMIKM